MRGNTTALWLGVAVAVAAAFPSSSHAAEPEAVWVSFDDKGLSPSQLRVALSVRLAELSPRAIERRLRAGTGTVVGERDLAPHPDYVRAVLGTGARLRAQSRWLNAISIEATPTQLGEIAALPHVVSVQPVARRYPDPPIAAPPPVLLDEADYGVAWEQLELMGVPALHDCGLDGSGVVVGVLDTGFVLDHIALQGVQVLDAHDFINDDDVVANEIGDPGGQHNHGSWVLAFVAGSDPGNYIGAAPGVSVLLAKTEDTSQEEPIEEDWFVEGLEWIEQSGADIATASLGYRKWYAKEDLDGQTAVTSKASAIAVQNGLIMFVAMGNAGPDPSTLLAPADTNGVISIGATQLDGTIAGFSSRGPTADGRTKPDVVAPGASVFTLELSTPDEYGTGSGTSFATPMAAGVGALLKQAYPNLGPAQMLELLTSTATNADAPDDTYGWGLIDAEAAGNLYCTCTDEDGDFHFDAECGGDDCDDQNELVYPGAEEICNGIDDNCDEVLLDGELDADLDGVTVCAGDCDDQDDAVNPDLSEICDDGVDNDCNDLEDAEDPACQPGGDESSGGDGGDSSGNGDGDGDGSASTGDDGETGDSTGSDDGAGIEDPGGCACTSVRVATDGPVRAWWAGLLLLAIRRRGR